MAFIEKEIVCEYPRPNFKTMLDMSHFLEILDTQNLTKPQKYELTKRYIEEILKQHKVDEFNENGGVLEFSFKFEKSKLVDFKFI